MAERYHRLHSTSARVKGFTLIELLVAITIMAIIAVLGWRGLDSIVRARVSLNADLEQMRGLQLAFAQMQRDCEHLANSTLIPNRAPLTVEAGRIVLVRSVFADGQPSRLEVVAYQLKDGLLTRRESESTRDLGALDALWLSVSSGGSASQPVALQAGVAEMAVQVWLNDGKGWRDGGPDVSIATTTGAGVTTSGPTGLKVTLRLQGRGGPMTKIFLLGAV